MATVPVFFSLNGAGVAGLSLSADKAFKVSDKSSITPTYDEVGSGWYNITYSGSDHAAATINGGTDNLDFRRVPVVFNSPVGDAVSVSGAVGSVSGAVGSVTGAVGSVTAAVTVGTNNDKTGYGLADNAITSAKIATGAITSGSFAANALDAVWSTAARTLTSYGTLVSDVTTAVWGAGGRTLTSFGTLVSDVATAVWAAGTRTLSSFGSLASDVTTAVWGATTRTLSAFGFTVTVGTNNDKSGYSLSTTPPTAAEVRAEMDSTSTKLAALPTETRVKQLLFNRTNTVADGLITGYVAGGDTTVHVEYDPDDVPTSEAIQ